METADSGTSAELRRVNVQRVLRHIRDHGPISRRDLGELGALSKPTVISVIDELLKADLVLEGTESKPATKATRGPTPRLVRFNSNHALVAGVDVGAAKMLALLSNLDGEVLAESRCATPPNATARWLDQNVKVLIDSCLEQAGVGRGRLAVTTVGTTGVVNRETGSIDYAPKLPGWQGRELKPILEESLGMPVVIESEAHLAMLGESWKGVAAGANDAVFVQMGVGVGMGILIGGEIYRGAVGAAGEIGYLPIGEAQPGGGPGAFETAVGSEAFTQHLDSTPDGTTMEPRYPSTIPSRFAGPAEVIVQSEADEDARLIVDGIMQHLASGLVSISAILNPELIVLGGGLSASLGNQIEKLRYEISTRVPAAPRLELSVLADKAVAVGAIKRGITFVEDQLFNLRVYAS